MFKRMSLKMQHQLLTQLRKNDYDKINYDEYVLTWDEVIELDRQPLITIGAHTHNHSALKYISDAELQDELLKPKQLLEKKLNHAIDHLSYPFGDIDQAGGREFNAAKENHYCSAFATNNGYIYNNEDKNMFALPRKTINYCDDMTSFKFTLSAFTGMRDRPLRPLLNRFHASHKRFQSLS